ncbi:MAG: hypothetical protein MI924_11835 [Chloroflexales bacterium]|nr:hypothetical protein [Chloroflexales bacterium]
MSEQHEKPDQTQKPDLASELRELGQQIEQALRGTLESDRAQTIQRDISSGLHEIGNQVQHALNAIRENPRMQELSERGQQAINQVQESPQIKDFQDTLARGVAQLNEQLANFVVRTRSGADTSSTSAQNVPIDDDPSPATGETTRLDPDKQP